MSCDESHTKMTDTKFQDSACATNECAQAASGVADRESREAFTGGADGEDSLEAMLDGACCEDALEAELKAMLDGADSEDALEAALENLSKENGAQKSAENSASGTAPETGGSLESENLPDASADTPSDDWQEDADGLWSSEGTFQEAPASAKTQAEREAEDKKLRAESYKIMANMGNFTLYFIVALIFTWFIGTNMDEFFNTKPVFTIFWIACGIASTVLEVRKTILAAKKLGETDQN